MAERTDRKVLGYSIIRTCICPVCKTVNDMSDHIPREVVQMPDYTRTYFRFECRLCGNLNLVTATVGRLKKMINRMRHS
jgi:hypothetical protein